MLRQQSFIMIKDLLFKVRLLGEYLHRSGHIPVRAGCGQEAMQYTRAELKAGHTILIFPEGALSSLESGANTARTGVDRQSENRLNQAPGALTGAFGRL